MEEMMGERLVDRMVEKTDLLKAVPRAGLSGDGLVVRKDDGLVEWMAFLLVAMMVEKMAGTSAEWMDVARAAQKAR